MIIAMLGEAHLKHYDMAMTNRSKTLKMTGNGSQPWRIIVKVDFEQKTL